jgi:hypothetical protein
VQKALVQIELDKKENKKLVNCIGRDTDDVPPHS